jgi:hypothetical protein
MPKDKMLSDLILPRGRNLDQESTGILLGMVQARVGQKLVKRNILRVFFVTDFVSVTLLLGAMMLNRNRLLFQ